jgi:hypothetical protein
MKDWIVMNKKITFFHPEVTKFHSIFKTTRMGGIRKIYCIRKQEHYLTTVKPFENLFTYLVLDRNVCFE